MTLLQDTGKGAGGIPGVALQRVAAPRTSRLGSPSTSSAVGAPDLSVRRCASKHERGRAAFTLGAATRRAFILRDAQIRRIVVPGRPEEAQKRAGPLANRYDTPTRSITRWMTCARSNDDCCVGSFVPEGASWDP